MRASIAILAAAAALCTLSAAPAHAAAPLSTGFQDGGLETLNGPGELEAGLANARRAGATVWRFGVVWRDVSPTKPPSTAAARDPSWDGYRWDRIDRIVRAATMAGLRPLGTVTVAPDWAEGPNPPPASPSMRDGAWRPSPTWMRAFATALATRYSGSHPDPLLPVFPLPRVPAWEPWNEPNLNLELAPQWTRKRGRWVETGPELYRRLHNAFYAGAKAADPGVTVIAGATAPYGDAPGGARMAPARFWRALLCVRDGKARRCGRTVRLDAVSHHPYPIGPPRRHARNRDDITIPDLARITRWLRPAVRAKTIRPARTTIPLWITEFSWDSRPDPNGLTLDQQATYLQGALYVLWQQGARTVVWFNLRDQAPDPSYAATLQSGVFFRGLTPLLDTPKPSFTAIRFPFTAYRSAGVARLWGRAPAAGAVIVEVRRGDAWVPAATLTAGANRVFTGRLRAGPNVTLRARQGTDASLSWRTQ